MNLPRRIMTPILSAALLLSLAACGPAAEETASPSVPASGPVSAAPASEEPSASTLEFADQIDWYNDNFDDFVMSEGELDGQPCYRLENETYGVTVLVPENGYRVQACVLYQDQSLTFDMPIFVLGYGAVSGVANLYLADLTGDGSPELIYIYGGGGTGAWNDQAKVIDLAAMTEYPVTWDNVEWENAVQLQFLGVEENGSGGTDAVYQISTGPDDEPVYASAFVPEGCDPENPVCTFGYFETITLDDGRLWFSTSFSAGLGEDLSLSGLGSLSAPFAYDPEAACFSLRPPLTMKVDQPAEPPIS